MVSVHSRLENAEALNEIIGFAAAGREKLTVLWFQHIPRELNTIADSLVKTAQDNKHRLELNQKLLNKYNLESKRTEAIAKFIFGDNYMDTLTSHLIMHRYAYVQVLFWGHPFTSGYDSIDYFISSDSYETVTGRGYRHEHIDEFSEQMVLFNSLTFTLTPESTLSEHSVSEGNSEGKYRFLMDHATLLDSVHLTMSKEIFAHKTFYVCVQSIMKMHPLFDKAILEILKSNPDTL